MRHEIRRGERVVGQPDVAVDDAIAERVQLAVDLDLVVVRLQPYLARQLLAQSGAAQDHEIQLVVLGGQLPLAAVVPRGWPFWEK